MNGVLAALTEWDSFYLIVGGAAGALIGLQFVVLTLVAIRPPTRAGEAGAAFATPTIVHFGAVLLLSAILRAPWGEITVPSALWGLMGVGGVAYSFVVVRRMRWQTVYQPELEDWVFHALLPLVAYVVLALSPLTAGPHTHGTLFIVGAVALLLLFVGIHNAWDSVTYHVFVHLQKSEAPPDEKPES